MSPCHLATAGELKQRTQNKRKQKLSGNKRTPCQRTGAGEA